MGRCWVDGWYPFWHQICAHSSLWLLSLSRNSLSHPFDVDVNNVCTWKDGATGRYCSGETWDSAWSKNIYLDFFGGHPSHHHLWPRLRLDGLPARWFACCIEWFMETRIMDQISQLRSYDPLFGIFLVQAGVRPSSSGSLSEAPQSLPKQILAKTPASYFHQDYFRTLCLAWLSRSLWKVLPLSFL